MIPSRFLSFFPFSFLDTRFSVLVSSRLISLSHPTHIFILRKLVSPCDTPFWCCTTLLHSYLVHRPSFVIPRLRLLLLHTAILSSLLQFFRVVFLLLGTDIGHPIYSCVSPPFFVVSTGLRHLRPAFPSSFLSFEIPLHIHLYDTYTPRLRFGNDPLLSFSELPSG